MLLKGQPCESNAEVGEILGKKGKISVPVCHNREIKEGELWILEDIKDFTQRKLFIGRCTFCNDYAVDLIEKRIADDKIYINPKNGIEAVKIIYREKNRKLAVIPEIKKSNLYGWVYGVNKEIKNKNGKTTQVRQYASDFSGKRELKKKIICR